MTQTTFLFYDLETSGLNQCFDQALQFAATRTDLNLNIIEQFTHYIRLNCDTVPSPEAMITHRIPLKHLHTAPNEFEVMHRIHRLLNTPNTLSIGYNILGFDDEFLRFSFYRNLLAPYTHQYLNGCGQLDLYPITILYYLFKSKFLKWPIIDGRISLKLEHLSQFNDLSHGTAHQATVDVAACLELSRRLMKDQKMWQYTLNFFNKSYDSQRISQLTHIKLGKNFFPRGLLIHGKLGTASLFQAPVLCLGQHQHYKNQTIWLRLDQEDLQKTTIDNITATTRTANKRLGEPPFLLPWQNQFLKHLTEDRKIRTAENLAWLEQNSQLLDHICRYYQNYTYPDVPFLDPDAALYKISFPTPHEEQLFKQFHQADPQDKSKFLDQFLDPVRKKQVSRILGRHYSDILSPNERAQFRAYIANIMQSDVQSYDYRGKQRLTPMTALEKIDALEKDALLDDQQKSLLTDLKNYLNGMLADF